MTSLANRSKKRRAEVDLDIERTLYTSFVSAANSVSQLYTQAVQQQRKAAASSTRQTLERVLGYVLREFPSSETIPRAALLHFLQQEYENADGCELAPHQFPVQLLPTVAQGVNPACHGPESPAPEMLHAKQGALPAQRQPTAGPHPMISPARRAGSHGPSAMDTAEYEAAAHGNFAHAVPAGHGFGFGSQAGMQQLPHDYKGYEPPPFGC